MVKQVIVWRKDLVVRTGKKMAQAAHSSTAWLAARVKQMIKGEAAEVELAVGSYFSAAELEWINGAFTKITLQVENEQQLLDLHKAALDAKLVCHLIQDAGKTEFNGVPTYTCLAIGPDYADKIDPITGHLKLY